MLSILNKLIFIVISSILLSCQIPLINITIINGNGSGTYEAGKIIEIAAVDPGENMRFYRWEGAVVDDAYSKITKLKVPSYHTTITAVYIDKDKQFILKVEGGTGSGIYKVDDEVEVAAIKPNGKSMFLNWYGDYKYLDNSYSTQTFVKMPPQDISIRADYLKYPDCKNINDKLIFKDYPVTNSFCLPPNKQGISDQDYGDASRGMGAYPQDQVDGILLRRYDAFKNQINAGMRIYNYWWSMLEHPNHVARESLEQTTACSSGYIRIPFDEQEKVRHGFNKFRCIKIDTLKKFDRLLKLDKQNDMQSAVVLYSAPGKYINKDCESYEHLKTLGCVPKDENMVDYEDYVRILATRYNGNCQLQSCKDVDPGKTKISHYVVWNEVDHSVWNRDGSVNFKITDGAKTVRIQKIMDKYTWLLRHTHNALKGNITGAMIYTSFTYLIDGPKYSYGGVQIGVYNVLDYIWEKIGLEIPWSVAFHAYGVKGNLTFSLNYLEDLLKYQRGKIAEKIAKPYSELNLRSYPQMYIYLSEQGFARDPKLDSDLTLAGEYICLAHKRQRQFSDFMIGSTHNYFYSTEDENAPNGCYMQGACFGLIRPSRVDIDFSNLENEETGEAFISTSLTNWGNNNEHYCCSRHNLGCLDVRKNRSEYKVSGNLDGLINGKVQGWAYDMDEPIRNIAIKFLDTYGTTYETKTEHIRNDISQEYFIPGNHGFSVDIGEFTKRGFKDGQINVYAIDHNGTNVKWIGSFVKGP